MYTTSGEIVYICLTALNGMTGGYRNIKVKK